MQKLYFGHPINTYNTDLERQLILSINVAFPDCVIENPNAQKHQDGYVLWREKIGNGMAYFIEEVLPHCGSGIFLAFRDGKFGSGVVSEMRFFTERNYPTWEILPNGDISALKTPHADRILSVEETRSRIRNTSGNTIPY